MKKVLVLGEDTRSFLSVVRSLGKAGYNVDVVCYDATSPALASKYISKTYSINFQSNTIEQWLNKVISITRKNRYDVIVPCDERAIFPLNEFRSKFAVDTRLALPNQAVLDHLFNKNSTKELAKELSVPHAKGKLIPLFGKSYSDLKAEFGCNFVIKPTESFKTDQLSKRQDVKIILQQQDFNEFIVHCQPSETYLVENYFEGIGEGLSIFAIDGEVHAAFAHRRVSEPKTGGGSSYRKSVAIDPSMLEAVKKLCRHTRYTGVGMFEFKKNDETGKWILIEVNARFWGSIPLAIFAGIDFPRLYINYLATGKVEKQFCYRHGVFARSLTNDIFDIKKEFDNLRYEGKLKEAILGVFARLSRYAMGLTKNESIDSYDPEDPQPFRVEVKQFYDNTVRPKLPAPLGIESVDQGDVLMRLYNLLQRKGDNTRITFVCYGNIMRSPFAAHYLQTLCNEVDLHWQIDSFGFHQNEARKSPKECVSVAHNLGIDLLLHRSKWLREEHIQTDDIIFVFDELNLDKMNRFYLANNVFNLADFIPAGLGSFKEIADPYGRGQTAVHETYVLIAEAIKLIFEFYRIKTCKT